MARAKTYDVCFEPLLGQSDVTLEQIRQLRNAEGVRKFMYQDHLISIEEHLRWLESMRTNLCEKNMVIRYHGAVVGSVAVRAIRWEDKAADWAFYLSESMQGMGVGSIVEFKLLDMAFDELGLEKLNCEVLANNPAVIEMHQKFGFRLEGVRRANVIKCGERMDVHLLGILAEEWQVARPRFERLFGINKGL